MNIQAFTRAISTWSPTLQQWTTTVTPPPGKTYTGQLNPRTTQVGGELSLKEG